MGNIVTDDILNQKVSHSPSLKQKATFLDVPTIHDSRKHEDISSYQKN
jgi:hypothetical protein